MKLEFDKSKRIEVKIFFKEKNYVFFNRFFVDFNKKLPITRYYYEITKKEKTNGILEFKENIFTLPLLFKNKDKFHRFLSFIMDMSDNNLPQQVPNKIGKIELVLRIKSISENR